MSREGVCGRCHGKNWLDRCRSCANWFCDVCFDVSGTVRSERKHKKLRSEDVAKLDSIIESPHEHQYKVFK